MGIHGLWKLLEPAGRDVTLESLENKILAIDVSLWLHQAQQGTLRGEAKNHPNAHLLTLFHRISKLLYYRIKPVFVFDGVAPALKKKTIAIRNQRKQVIVERAEEIRQKLLKSLAKSGALNAALQKKILKPSPSKTKKASSDADEEMYNLPPMPVQGNLSPVEEHSGESWGSEGEDLLGYYEEEDSSEKSDKSSIELKKWTKWVDPHEVNVQDESFKALPVEVRREILTDLKEARKESSWGRLHKMPKNLDSFSSFQMSRLLHRRKVQEEWEGVEKELAATEVKGASLGELQAILSEKGVDVDLGLGNHRIASDEKKGFILLSGLNNQVSEANEKTNLNLLKTVKEEPEEVKEQAEDIIPEEEEIKRVARKRKRSESLRDPSSLESEMLSEKKVKDFIRVAIGGSEDGSEVGEDVENKEDLWGEPEDGLSQAELLELIKEQNEGMVESKSENAQKKPDAFPEGMESKEVSVNTSVTDHDKNSGLLKEIKVEMETNIANQIVDMNCNESLNISKGDSSFVASKAVRNEKEGQVEASTKGGQIMADITLESEEELSDIEITGIVEEKMKTKDVVQKVKGMTPSCDVMVKTTIETFTKEEEDSKGKCRRITEDLMEEVIVEEKESEGLTQEEILALIKTQSHSAPGDKVKDDVASGTSDSESFLEVEEEAATDEEKKVTKPEKLENLEKPVEELSKNEKEKKKLEVIIHPDENPDDSTDIFADVFESNTVEGDVIMDKSEPVLTEKLNIPAEMSEEDVEEPNEDADITEKVPEAHEDEREMKPLDDERDESLTEEERHRMTLEMKKLEREANTGVTERARLESQELLGLFGVPWVVAPFEAEAQCAFLEKSSPMSPKFGSSSSIRKFLAEGTVTEDSDIWAFGAATVYRHVFDRRRTRVRLYTKEDIYKKLGLTRSQVVQLALLTGSDYTIGLPGVGTVTALEIIAAFPGEKTSNPGSSEDAELDDVISGLEHFADWWKRVELNEEKGEPVGHSYYDPNPEIAEKLRSRLLTCWKTLQSKQPGASLLPAGFPSRAVAQAYLKPSVDDCRDTFTWLKPDEAALRSYAQLHFGWTREKTDSILQPLFARLKLSDCKDRTQTSLHSFFSHLRTDPRPGDLESSNVGVRAIKALERIAGKLDDNTKRSVDEGVEQQKKGEGKKAQGSSERVIPKISKALNPKGRGGSKVNKQIPKDEVLPKVLSVTSGMETGFSSSLYSSDNIPQRQKDNNNALQSKLKAIEVLRKTSMGRGKRPKEGTRKGKDSKKLKREEVKLSESSESD